MELTVAGRGEPRFVIVCRVHALIVAVRSASRQVWPPGMGEWPLWLRDLWFGPVGDQHNEMDKMRLAFRKFARQINCALCMVSQVRCAEFTART